MRRPFFLTSFSSRSYRIGRVMSVDVIESANELLPIDVEAAIEAAETGPFGSKPSLPQFLRFGVVGCVGFVWDTSTVYLTKASIGLMPAILLAFLVAATLNWALNRAWTFRHAPCDHSLPRQWALYMAANSLGFVLNRGTAYSLVLMSGVCRSQPILALAAGAGAGLFANFVLSQRFVFRTQAPTLT